MAWITCSDDAGLKWTRPCLTHTSNEIFWIVSFSARRTPIQRGTTGRGRKVKEDAPCNEPGCSLLTPVANETKYRLFIYLFILDTSHHSILFCRRGKMIHTHTHKKMSPNTGVSWTKQKRWIAVSCSWLYCHSTANERNELTTNVLWSSFLLCLSAAHRSRSSARERSRAVKRACKSECKN